MLTIGNHMRRNNNNDECQTSDNRDRLLSTTLIAFCFAAFEPKARAQTATQNQNSTPDTAANSTSAAASTNAGSANNANAEILKELERMRARIRNLRANSSNRAVLRQQIRRDQVH